MEGRRMDLAWPEQAAEWDRAVARYLRDNPDWLAGHPEVYRALRPPARVHGEVLADHMAAMVMRERQHAAAMEEQTEAILAVGRATGTMLTRIHEVVVALIAAASIVDWLHAEMPRIMGADAAFVALFGGQRGDRGEAGRLDCVLGADSVILREDPADAAVLYDEAAPLAGHDALIRLPEVGVLAIAWRGKIDPELRHSRPGLAFLGQAVGAAIEARR
jgi:uncharacterized protein YigA (DUF484 family)